MQSNALGRTTPKETCLGWLLITSIGTQERVSYQILRHRPHGGLSWLPRHGIRCSLLLVDNFLRQSDQIMKPRVFFIILFFTSCCFSATSDAQDKNEQNLIRATEAYEKVMEKYRKTVTTALERAEVKARQAGPEQLRAVEDQKLLFEKFGCTPALCSSSLWSQRASAHKRIVKAYRLAIASYTRDKEDDKAAQVLEKLNNFWPAFLDDAEVGGWIPYGSPRMEVQDGVVTLTAGRGLSGIMTKRNDLSNSRLDFELACSADINAWIGVQMTQVNGKAIGSTCQIRTEGGGPKAGFHSRKFALQEDDGRKQVFSSGEFFNEGFEVRHADFDFEIFVNGKMTVGAGGQTNLRYPGATALLVERGVLIVRAASQGGVAK